MTRAELTAAFWALPEADRTAFLAGVQAHMRAERRAADPARTAAKRTADADRQARKREAARLAAGERPSMSVGVAPPSEACPSTDNAATSDGFVDGQATDLSPAPLSSEGEGEEISRLSSEVSLSLITTTSPARAGAASEDVRRESRSESATDYVAVGKAYAERWERETGDGWQSIAANQADLDAIARHCVSVSTKRGVTFDAVLAEVLDGAFADAWMRSEGWPIRAIAKSPGRFARPKKPRVAPHTAFGDPRKPRSAAEMASLVAGGRRVS